MANDGGLIDRSRESAGPGLRNMFQRCGSCPELPRKRRSQRGRRTFCEHSATCAFDSGMNRGKKRTLVHILHKINRSLSVFIDAEEKCLSQTALLQGASVTGMQMRRVTRAGPRVG